MWLIYTELIISYIDRIERESFMKKFMTLMLLTAILNIIICCNTKVQAENYEQCETVFNGKCIPYVNGDIEITDINKNIKQNIQNNSYTVDGFPINYTSPKTIKIPAGTAITVYTEHEIDADKVKRGQNVDFIVQEPVSVNGIQVIKAGTHVTAQVTKKKNNFIFGVPGEVEVGNFKITNSQIGVLNMRGIILDKGTGKYWSNIGWLLVWPLLFIKGNDGKIPAGTYQVVYTTGETIVNLENL